jgi:signal peptidase II
MYLGQEYHIFDNWFIIHFTENNGMAFGMQFGGETGKIFLSIFRIIVVGVIGWYLYSLIKDKAHSGFINTISLIFAGALGNIIDCVFYGKIFSDSLFQVATFLPKQCGYSSLLQGKVVDMLYFPLIDTYLPDWLPVFGSRHFIFFRPVFNIADASITIGVILLILFQKKFFNKISGEKKQNISDIS